MSTLPVNQALTLLDNLGTTVKRHGGMPTSVVETVESHLATKFPPSYRQFLQDCGALSVGRLVIYGISLPVDREPSVVWALQALREASPDVPDSLLPFHSMESDGLVACLQCSAPGYARAEAPVVLWRLGVPLSEQRLEPVNESFADYLYDRLAELANTHTGLQTMEKHVKRFDEEYLSAGRLPRNHIWRPYRFCVQDVVLGLVVVRHSLERNCLEVDVCLTSEAPEYESDSGARMTSAFLLSEAYKCGGTMEVRFSENVEHGRVPAALSKFALDLGVALDHRNEGRITASESRRFYVALTGFSPELRDAIGALAQAGRLSQESACYVVHHGLWTRPEVESVVFGSQRPDSIFRGAALPELRHLYMHDILHGRAAILGGALDRRLARRERGDGSVAIDLEDDTRRLDISFDARYYAKVYQCDEDIPVPWLEHKSSSPTILPAGERLVALVRARSGADLTLHIEEDLTAAAGRAELARQHGEAVRLFLLVPRDFEEIPVGARSRLLTNAAELGVGVMVCPETTASLDADVARRLTSSRILRQ